MYIKNTAPESLYSKNTEYDRNADNPGTPVVETQNRSFAGQDLRNSDMSMRDLSGADFTDADLSGAKLFKTDLRNALLLRTKLHGAELTGANLDGAQGENTDLRNCGLGMAKITNAKLFNANLSHSTLTKADLSGSDLKCALLKNARVREANLSGVDMTGADLRGADLSLSNVEDANFNNADLRDCRLRMLQNYQSAKWYGADIRDINFAGAYRMRRFIVDQNYLKEFKEESRVSKLIYDLWWLTSDCGRSVTRWFMWILLLICLFAFLYTFVEIDYGEHPTWFSPLYFSIVTITTLGYGDVVPSSPASQMMAIAEVISGYLMLGGLISIFSNKIARRAE